MIVRRAYAGLRAAALLTAVAVACLFAPRAIAGLRPDGADFVLAALAIALALGYIRPPTAHFERSSRPTPDSDRIGLMVPLLLVVVVREGWFWAAVCAGLADLTRPAWGRHRHVADRILNGALRFLGRATIAPLAATLHDAAAAPATFGSLALFTGLAAAWIVAVDLLWIDPIAALRRGRSLLRVWARHLRDLGTFLAIVLEAAWGGVLAHVAVRENALVSAALLLSTIAFALLLVRLARANARLHRLALSREAVDAMLRASDPQPQVRLLLETIDPRIVREAVEVAAFGRRGNDRWSRLVRFGGTVPAELERLGGRALLEVQVTGDDATLEAPHGGTVRAFAARDAEGGLRGALVVFRPPGSTGLVATRELERAAAELGPLLREFGAIAATRSAATIDTLTGLPNRRGVARAFDDAMEHVRAGGRYAVLLLDVDHFKSVNDLLGHQTGDRALARIGRLIAENIRGIDVAGRFGGEEFLVLLRDASRERALQIAERLRAAIEASGLAYADGKPLTISVGVAYARALDAPHEVVERADQALYRAKNAGRNRVVESPLVAV